MESLACLNCDTIVEGKFCSNCGQKTDTHRITAKHFFFHDLLHGVWHIEKGILFTIKQALLRPGVAALEYISGKRIKYYNVFYLILLVIGLTILAGSTYDKMSKHYFGTEILENITQAGRNLDKFITDYAKLIIYAFVPFFALNSLILFRKKRFNYSEHLIIAGMIFLGVMTILLLYELLYFTYFLKNLDFISTFLQSSSVLIVIIFVLFNYFRTFKNEYKMSTIVFKLLLFIFMIIAESFILGYIIIGFFKGWTWNMLHF